MMLKKYLISFFILLIAVFAYAEEPPIIKYEDRTLSEVNEQLRKLDIDEQVISAGKMDMHSHPIDNVEDPTDAQDAATKNYIDVRLPAGVIVMWSGTVANIPTGWVLCDGTNSTPDLRDKFVVGAKQDDGGVAKTNITGSLTQSGGSTTIAEANLPSHTHTGPSHTHAAGTLTGGAHVHDFKFSSGTSGAYLSAGSSDEGTDSQNTESGGAVAVTGSTAADGTGATGTIGSGTAYTQPYYSLCFIQKT